MRSNIDDYLLAILIALFIIFLLFLALYFSGALELLLRAFG